jgi:hypothetical protein
MSVCVGKYNNCGSRSQFYIIDEQRGFKDFETEEDAQYAHYVQSKLAIHNLAPKAGDILQRLRRLSAVVETIALVESVKIYLIACLGKEIGW